LKTAKKILIENKKQIEELNERIARNIIAPPPVPPPKTQTTMIDTEKRKESLNLNLNEQINNMKNNLQKTETINNSKKI